MRMNDEHIVRRMLDVDIPGKRRRGRRNLTWKDACNRDIVEAIVRLHLEYGMQPWTHYLRKDIDMLEKIQRRATNLIPGLRDITYDERLKECGLKTLETRRLRGIKYNCLRY